MIKQNVDALRIKAKYPQTAERPVLTVGFVGDIQYADRDHVNSRDYRSGIGKLKRLLDIYKNEKIDLCIGLGDIGDGIHKDEIPQVLQIYQQSGLPVRHIVGNHDFVLNTEDELKPLLNIPGMYYDFSMGNIRFIAINSLDVSRFSPPGSVRLKAAQDYRKKYPGLRLRDWDGMLSEEQYLWLEKTLLHAKQKGEKVILLSHVPVCPAASASHAWLWESSRFLRLLKKFDHILACFSGHYHPGGTALFNNILHKTVKAVCDHREITGTIARIYSDRIELQGFGEETNLRFDFIPAKEYEISGTAPAGSFVVTNTGILTRTDANGNFTLKVSEKGVYALRVMADGYADAVIPFVEAPNSGITAVMQPEADRRVITGDTHGFASLKITENGKPLQGFDLQGIRHGSIPPLGNMWQEYNDLFWSRGKYAFSANGEVKIQPIPHYPQLRQKGYFKGDFHAHIIHAENIYYGNLLQSAFIARAENYDWIGLSGYFCNDGYVYDNQEIAKRLSDDEFLCFVNNEYPKNNLGHFGNIACPLLYEQSDPDKMLQWEVVEKNILPENGLAIPVHPIYDGSIQEVDGKPFCTMAAKEMYLLLLTQPECVPCLDLFYNNDDLRALPLYLALLDRGYRIGITATSDAAFDVGRTPGNRGATFVLSGELREEALLRAFRERRTMISFDQAALMLTVDGKVPGDVLKPGKHHFKVEFFPGLAPGGVLEIYRNGKLFQTFLPKQEIGTFEGDFEENANGYILAVYRDNEKYYSVTSAIYFRNENFKTPEVLPCPRAIPEFLREKIKFMTSKELCAPETLDMFREILLKLSK